MKRAGRLLLVWMLIGLFALSYGSSASAQQPEAQETGAVDANGFPVKAPPGWNQKHWDVTLRYCNHIAQKARAHQPTDEGELAGSGVCKSLSVDFLNPQKGPLPGSYLSPDRPHPAPSSGSPDSPQSENVGSNLSLLPARKRR